MKDEGPDEPNPSARSSNRRSPPAPDTPSSLPVDLSSLSDDDLALLTVEAPRELERRKAKREQEILAFIREQAATQGIPLKRIVAALGKKRA